MGDQSSVVTRRWTVGRRGPRPGGIFARETSAANRLEVEVFYARHHRRLARLVARDVSASHAVVEDACQFAWEAFLRRGEPLPEAEAIPWLRVVARREGWRLARRSLREAAPEDPPQTDGGEAVGWEGRIADARSLESRRALEALLALTHRERTYMTLRVAGYSYGEICELTGATYTNVNKHLTRARARLRERFLGPHS